MPVELSRDDLAAGDWLTVEKGALHLTNFKRSSNRNVEFYLCGNFIAPMASFHIGIKRLWRSYFVQPLGSVEDHLDKRAFKSTCVVVEKEGAE